MASRLHILCILLCFALIGCSKKQPGLQFQSQLLHTDFNEGCAVGDLDNDGDLDVVAGEFWYANPEFEKPIKLRELTRVSEDMLESNGDHLFDVNKDGLLDVVSGGFFHSKIDWFENPGSSQQPTLWTKRSLVDTGSNQNEIYFLEDLEEDGSPELISNSWAASEPVMAWNFIQGESDPVLVGEQIRGAVNGHGMGFGDLDADGVKDILLPNGWYKREGTAWAHQPAWQLGNVSCPMLVVDLEEDGQPEVIWGNGHHYGMNILRYVGGEWENTVIDDTFSQAHTLLWADLDADGKEELITGKRYHAHSGHDPGAADTPVLYYFKWTGKTFERYGICEGIGGTGLQLRVADLNTDGYLDVIAAGKNGTYIHWNQGLAGQQPTPR